MIPTAQLPPGFIRRRLRSNGFLVRSRETPHWEAQRREPVAFALRPRTWRPFDSRSPRVLQVPERVRSGAAAGMPFPGARLPVRRIREGRGPAVRATARAADCVEAETRRMFISTLEL